MKIIYKYPLRAGFGVTRVTVPEVHTVLSIQLQDGCPVMWCLVDTGNPYFVHVNVTVLPTGREIFEDIGKHISTWQNDGLVYHAFINN